MTAKPEPLFHCILCGRSGFVKKAAHKVPPGGSKAAKCPGDFKQISATPCWTCNFQANKACPDPIVISACPWSGCHAWIAKPSVATVALVAAPAPALKTGDDAEVATQFKKSFADAQGALQRVLAFGVYAAHIKYNCLKHGQFRRWVHAQCGEQAYRSVRSYLKLTEGVLKACGTKSLKAAVSKWQQLPFCRSGQFLLADVTEVPESVQPLRDKVLKLIENKTQRQLFFEFKQAEDGDSDNVKPKRGRRKGEGGATKAQRAAKAAADAAAEKAGLEQSAKDFCKWLEAKCVATKIGARLSDATLQSLNDWCKVAYDYTSGILQARQKGPATT